MANITTQDFTTLVRNQVTAIQGACNKLLDLSIGSILRSVVESNSAVVLWLQGLILQLLATTRAATSSDADLDSWVADFGFSRLAAVAASGQVAFSRFTPTLQALIPVGNTIQTADGTQQFAVSPDTTNPAYSAALGGYVLAAGVTSVTVLVAAAVAGAGGNVSAGQINTITAAIPGVDTVSNPSAFTNGADAESDPALRSRFVSWVSSLSKATKTAILYAILSLKQGSTATLVENQLYNGTAQNGYFYAVVDDGTGAPGSVFLSSAANAIDAVRPFTVNFGVFAPSVVTANVAMTITTAAGYDHAATALLVKAAIQSYINALALGQSLPYTQLSSIAYSVQGVASVLVGYTLNGGTSDITATAQQVIKAGTVTVA